MTFAFRKQKGGIHRGEHAQQRQAVKWPVRLLVGFLLGYISFMPLASAGGSVSAQAETPIYLPAVFNILPSSTPLIHIPFFESSDVFRDRYSEMAVFWFGKVSPTENYTHVRAGYNRSRLSIEVNTYDKDLWYDQDSPSAGEVSHWDAASIYLNIPANGSNKSRLLRFDAQIMFWEDRQAYQAVFEKTASGWTRITVPFTTESAYRGDGINLPANDKGWILNYEIPFASLGLAAMPPSQSEWRVGLRVYDQDTGPGGKATEKAWPGGFTENNLNSFGRLSFGIPTRNTPPSPASGSVTIKQGPGVKVPDGSVGGSSTCGGSLDYWTEWGNQVYDTGEPSEVVVIQNQRDVSDFPCFSRYYITFPMGAIPQGKVILSAKLTLRQFGNSDPAQAYPSYIQVFRVKERWAEETLSWNNSPQVLENYPGAWVDPLPSFPGVPGVTTTWDVTQALIDSMRSETPQEMRLALYSADGAMHSGKYFWSSETASWSSVTPPTLVVQWANP